MARRTVWIGRAAGGLLGLFMASPALAADGLAEHAPEIIADLQALREPALFESGGHRIAEVDGGYTLTLEDVRFIPDARGHVEAGDVAVRLVPEPGGYRITSFELPAEMPVRLRGEDRPAGLARLGGYDVDGFWSIAERAFLSLDIEATGLELVEADSSAAVVMERGHSSFVDTPGADGKWREEGRMEIHGLTTDIGGSTGGFGEITLTWSVEDMDRAGMEEFKRLFTAAAGDGGAPPAPAELARLRQLGSLFAKGHSVLEMRDMRGDNATSIAYGRIEMRGDGLDQALSQLSLGLRFDGIEVAVPGATGNAVDAAMAPQSLDLSLAVEDLPGRAFWDAMLDGMATVEGEAGQGEDGWAEEGQQQAMLHLVLALQEAGTRLRLGASRVSAPAGELFAEGMLQAHAPAALGAVAALTLDVVGLEALSRLAAEGGGSEAAAGLRELVAWLENYGKAATAPSGEASQRLDIVVDAGGLLTVNGRELPLFGAPPSEMEN